MSLASPSGPCSEQSAEGNWPYRSWCSLFLSETLDFFFRAFHAPVQNFKKHYVPNISREFLITIKSHACVTGGRTKLRSFGFVCFFLKTVFYPKNCIGPSVWLCFYLWEDRLKVQKVFRTSGLARVPFVTGNNSWGKTLCPHSARKPLVF